MTKMESGPGSSGHVCFHRETRIEVNSDVIVAVRRSSVSFESTLDRLKRSPVVISREASFEEPLTLGLQYTVTLSPGTSVSNLARLQHVPTRSLRYSSSLSIYMFLHEKLQWQGSNHMFSSVASDTWNKLPCHLSSISALPVFRKRLKHHFFSNAFPAVFPLYPLTPRFVTYVITSTNVNHIICTLPPS